MGFITAFDDFFIDLALSVRCGFLTAVFAFFSFIGNSGLCWIALGLVLLCVRRTRKMGLSVLICLLVTFLIANIALKNIIARDRPFMIYDFLETIIAQPTDWSFPSGHTASSFTAATAIFLYNKRAGLGAYLAALMIAASRLYFTVHFATDVLGGAVIGITVSVIIVKLIFPAFEKAYRKKLFKSGKKITLSDGFTAEPIPSDIFERINGVSYRENNDITLDMLHYIKVRYIGFDKKAHEGELIASRLISRRLLHIFKKLYEKGYELERVELIDNFGADDDKSMTANNTSAFCYRTIANQKTLSNHALGLAVDINPLYNPYIQNGVCLPAAAEAYADRTRDFPHKLDKKDYAVRLFKSYGFDWGGDWKGKSVDWQHFAVAPTVGVRARR